MEGTQKGRMADYSMNRTAMKSLYSKRICLMTLILLLSVFVITGAVCAAQESFRELDYGDGQKLYILLPEDYDPDREYPSVYFMPQDGAGAQQYLYDRIDQRIRDLEDEGRIPAMIYVFPQIRSGEDLFAQMQEAVDAVEENYSAMKDPLMRGAAGTGVGGYLALLLGYTGGGQKIEEKPLLFCAVASHDGDFTSGQNPFHEMYGDLLSILKESVRSYSEEKDWISHYYTYIDCNSDSAAAWADGGTADIASLYRNAGLTDQKNRLAWDYGVFDYAILPSEKYGTYLDRLDASLTGFARAFGLAPRPEEETETELRVQETIVSGENRRIDLMGDWFFRTVNALMEDGLETDVNSIDVVLKSDWDTWDQVQPGLDWWDENFADCLDGNPYYTGYAWYIREFEVPDGFDTSGLQIQAGMLDEADEVYLNKVRVGQTGIPEEGGSYDGSNRWDEERVYPIPDGLLTAGSNTIAVRMCNGSGGGGWYAGPIQIETVKDESKDPAGEKQRFYTDTFKSDSLNGREIEYRVYLPEGYYESELYYPVIYMLHGYGSTGKSFEIAGVPRVMDEGIAAGEIPPCIVIFPTDSHPDKMSWWAGAYADMLNKDLVTHIDRTLRTVDDRTYRFLAGESMGGAGAYLNALRHPEQYGGVFDIYGGLRYNAALGIFLQTEADELKKLRHYIICGNHDMYGFDIDHMMMGKYLVENKIPHVLEIDDGEHSSTFYLPRLKEGFAYLLSGLTPLNEEELPGNSSIQTQEGKDVTKSKEESGTVTKSREEADEGIKSEQDAGSGTEAEG